jgi:hypothetical protein
MKGGGKPSAALSVGSRAFVNPKTLGESRLSLVMQRRKHDQLVAKH